MFFLTKKRKKEIGNLFMEFEASYVLEKRKQIDAERKRELLTPVELMELDKELREIRSKRNKVVLKLTEIGVL